MYSIGLNDEDLSGLDDWDLWIRIAELYPVIAIQQPVMIWRRSTPVSNQGSSNAARLVNDCTRQFKRSWIDLPRMAAGTIEQRKQAWRGFSLNMAKHLMWESNRAAKALRPLQAVRNFSSLFPDHIQGALRAAFRPKSLSMLLSLIRRDAMESHDESGPGSTLRSDTGQMGSNLR